MAKVGSKKKYDESFPQRALELAEKGLTDKEISKQLGIATSTFYEYKKEHSEFSDALKRGKQPVDNDVENALLKKALGYDYEEQVTEARIGEDGTLHPAVVRTLKKHMPADATAQIFWLKNRMPKEWRDGKSIELTDKDGALLAPKAIEITIKKE
jgi:hypothetical protein